MWRAVDGSVLPVLDVAAAAEAAAAASDAAAAGAVMQGIESETATGIAPGTAPGTAETSVTRPRHCCSQHGHHVQLSYATTASSWSWTAAAAAPRRARAPGPGCCAGCTPPAAPSNQTRPDQAKQIPIKQNRIAPGGGGGCSWASIGAAGHRLTKMGGQRR